jgi:hypothetical protein
MTFALLRASALTDRSRSHLLSHRQLGCVRPSSAGPRIVLPFRRYRGLYLAALMTHRHATQICNRPWRSPRQASCVIAGRRDTFDHRAFCPRLAAFTPVTTTGRTLYRLDGRLSSHPHGLAGCVGVAVWTGAGRSGGRARARYFNPDVCCLRLAPAVLRAGGVWSKWVQRRSPWGLLSPMLGGAVGEAFGRRDGSFAVRRGRSSVSPANGQKRGTGTFDSGAMTDEVSSNRTKSRRDLESSLPGAPYRPRSSALGAKPRRHASRRDRATLTCGSVRD